MPAIRPHTQKPANRRKDLLDEQSSATQARVTFDDPTFRFANTEFFSVLLGYVRDGSAVQQNVVRADGRRSVLLSVIKNGNASTVDVVNGVKAALKVARASAPPGMEIKELFDQSVFVSASVGSVLREGRSRPG